MRGLVAELLAVVCVALLASSCSNKADPAPCASDANCPTGSYCASGGKCAAVPTTFTFAITPSTAAVTVGDTYAFQISGMGGATWTVQETGGGTIDAAGEYQAPAAPGAYHVIATSTADSSKTASAAVSVVAAPIAKVTAPAVADQGATHLVASVPVQAGSTYQWTIAGGQLTAGSGTASIEFTAGTGATVSLNCTVTNAAGTSASGSATVTITIAPIAPQIQAATTLTQGSTNAAASVSNPSNQLTYNWQIQGGVFNDGSANGSSTATGASVTFNAGNGSSLTLTCTAKNAAGETASNTATISLAPATLLPVISAPATLTVNKSAVISIDSPQAGINFSWTLIANNGTAYADPSHAGQTSPTATGSSVTLIAGPSAGAVTLSVSAVNAAGQSMSASATVNIVAISVSVAPATATIEAGGTQQFSATVTNASNAVTWTVQESAGGSVSASGLYSAPPAAGVFHVVAASVDDSTRTGSAAITVLAKPALSGGHIGVAPLVITGGAGTPLSLALPTLANPAGTFTAASLSIALTQTGGATPQCSSPSPAHACTSAEIFAAISGAGALAIAAPASLPSDNDSIGYSLTVASLAPAAVAQTASGAVSVVPLPALSGTSIGISPATITAGHTGSLSVSLPTLTNAPSSYTSSTFTATLKDQAGVTPTCTFPSPAHACTGGELFSALGGNGSLTLAYPASVAGDDRSVTYTLSVGNQATTPATATAANTVAIVPAPSAAFAVTTLINAQQAPMISSTLTQAKAGNVATATANAGWTYAWTIGGAGATIDAGAGTNQISFTAGTGASMTLQCAATNAAGDVDTQLVTIGLVPPPQINAFTSSPGRIPVGSSFILKPVFIGGSGTIDLGIGAATSGSGVTLSPVTPTTYTLNVVNAAGDVAVQTAFISVSNIFVDGPAMITPRAGHTGTLLTDGRVLFAGGITPVAGGGQPFTASAEIFDPAGNNGAGSFTATGSLGTARSGATATLLPSGKVLVAGGYNNGELASTELFDPFANGVGAFSPGPDLLNARTSPYSVALPSGRVLIIGGFGALDGVAQLELFDPKANAGAGAFTAGPSLSGGQVNLATMLLPNGLVWIAGGETVVNQVATSNLTYQLYDPASGTLSASETLPIQADAATPNLLPNGDVLLLHIFGQSAVIYNPFTDTFASTSGLITTRSTMLSQTLPTGLVLYAGGQKADVELFDPSGNSGSGSFTAIQPLKLKRDGSSMIQLHDGRVLIAAGQALQGATLSFPASTQIYDPTGVGGVGSFSATGSLTTSRSSANVALLENGKVLVAGGQTGTGGGSGYSGVTSAELYDPAASSGVGAFTATGDLSSSQQQAAVARLPNGKVLVAGGFLQTASFLFDPQGNSGAGSFTATGNMTVARAGATATLLSNGEVLVFGGFTGGNNAISAELYDPAGNGGAGSFSAITATLNGARLGANGTLLPDGRVLVSGGCATNVAACYLELFDPAANGAQGLFSRLFFGSNVASSGGAGATATVMRDGQVLIAGGTLRNAVVNMGTIFNPAFGGFASQFGPSLGTARSGAAAALLPNGQVLVAGGTDVNGNTLSSAEIFDPATQAFSPAGQLATPRTGGQAVALPNGKVLFVGGMNGQATLSSAEVFQLQ